ncbi:hypothetical protein [Corallococcus carmarthensis]|nr:hypothetical protein [Corallococcus carmarthensis]
MFRNVNISGVLIVASGTMIRATGDITIAPNASIVVNAESQIQTINPSQKGIAMSASFGSQGGKGQPLGRTATLSRADLAGGGSGYRSTTNSNISGGDGGPRLILAAKGNIVIRGSIDAAGRHGLNTSSQNNSPTPVAGGGGGGGGVVSLVSRGTLTVDADGKILANGGNGANGWAGTTPVAGQLFGGGGGGGGGIIQLLSANPPVIANTALLSVAGGTAGLAAVSGTPTTLVQVGGGGGASGGEGGDGTASTAASGAAKDGSTGDYSITVTPQPEWLFN